MRTAAVSMDFFASQEAARRKTSVLVAYYIVAVALIVVAVYAAFVLTFAGVQSQSGPEAAPSRLWNPGLFLWVAGGTVVVVLAGTLFKISQLARGGESVAQLLGGRPLSPNTAQADERRLLNVVEEMALASGTGVPRVFVLDDEPGINAFAAGFSARDAVIGVTRGCVSELTRDELQGVIAHEFSHILNGDMRLNIRLMGILNGILVISLIGRAILRSSAVAPRRSRSDGKRGGGGLGLLGLLLMVIGFIGVFFGKLIKSAVARQREYLADASGVQFTRNPLGLADALRKIGGYSRGSQLQTRHAEEASHLYFANGVGRSLLHLMATHPPIEERIRRIDPSFAGGPARPYPTAAGEADAGSPAAAAFAVDPRAVMEGVGAPRHEHLRYAAALMASWPPPVVEAARDPLAARAVVYGLLLSRDGETRRTQAEALQRHAAPGLREAALRLAGDIAALGPASRLPLADVAVSALKDLSPAQYAGFRSTVGELVEADRQIDLFEFTLQRMILRRLAPVFEGARPTSTRFGDLKPLLPRAAELLSCLAYWGGEDLASAERAFAAGAERLGADGPLAPLAPAACGLNAVDRALADLAAASPALRKRILDACVSCIAADGQVTVEEAELLRAVSDSLDCPLPPLLPGQAVAA